MRNADWTTNCVAQVNFSLWLSPFGLRVPSFRSSGSSWDDFAFGPPNMRSKHSIIRFLTCSSTISWFFSNVLSGSEEAGQNTGICPWNGGCYGTETMSEISKLVAWGWSWETTGIWWFGSWDGWSWNKVAMSQKWLSRLRRYRCRSSGRHILMCHVEHLAHLSKLAHGDGI